MALKLYSGVINPKEQQSIALVLQASQSDRMWELTTSIANQISQFVRINLFFMGCQDRHDFNGEELSFYRTEHMGRASLITPVYKTLSAKDTNYLVVVIYSGRVFDEDDWRNTPIWKRTLWKRVDDNYDCSRLVEEVRRWLTITRVELRGKGFMPVEWDNDIYKLQFDTQGKAILQAENTDGTRDLKLNNLRYLACDCDSGINVSLTFGNNKKYVKTLKPSDDASRSLGETISLNEDEKSKVRGVVDGTLYECPRCNTLHAQNSACPQQSMYRITGVSTFPTLGGKRGFAVFELEGEDVHCHHYKGQVLWLGNNQCAVRDDGRQANIYTYDESSDCWRFEQALRQYHDIGGNKYAILL